MPLQLEVRHEPRGFRNSGDDPQIAAGGSYFTDRDWLPALG